MHMTSANELHAFETEHGVRIPSRLSAFLINRGPGIYGEVEIHAPQDVLLRYHDFFDNPRDLITRYFPFGCNNRTQEMWVLDLSRSVACVAKIWHETVPDDWAEEEWVPFETCRDPEFDHVGI
jgi:hypothetical protein